jgi:hypothetical protein
MAVAIEEIYVCSAGRANRIARRVLVKKLLFNMGMPAMQPTPLSPSSL